MAFDLQKSLQLIGNATESLSLPAQPNELYEPIRYLLSLGGKRMRPLLTLLGASLYSDQYEKALPVAISAEVFHNFTLMHDDIMDKAPLRRGKETVHTKWNDSIAILSGDVMLVKAYDLLLEAEVGDLKKLLSLFNRCAAGVCEGQQLDMNFETLSLVSQADYLEMIRLKTAVLLGYCLESGAICGGASEEEAHELRLIGEEMGVCFQLMDDLLDVYGAPDKVGKQVAGDIIANKKTMLLIMAQQLATGPLAEKLTYWLSVTSFEPVEKIEAVKEVYAATRVKELTEQLMEDYFKKAVHRLEKLPVMPERKAPLLQLFTNLFKRES